MLLSDRTIISQENIVLFNKGILSLMMINFTHELHFFVVINNIIV